MTYLSSVPSGSSEEFRFEIVIIDNLLFLYHFFNNLIGYIHQSHAFASDNMADNLLNPQLVNRLEKSSSSMFNVYPIEVLKYQRRKIFKIIFRSNLNIKYDKRHHFIIDSCHE
ncbi:unnamed protein product [Adineta ricciae]|uniref:Uncharacterized protein n=1 Tax=Adineta ricciae TaxID=249248 RepID=A0A813WW94_ADIRI|nr:unnamed protein product [Adineta ricciae]